MVYGDALLVLSLWLMARAAALGADEEAPAKKPLGFFDILALPEVWISAIFCAVGLMLLCEVEGQADRPSRGGSLAWRSSRSASGRAPARCGRPRAWVSIRAQCARIAAVPVRARATARYRSRSSSSSDHDRSLARGEQALLRWVCPLGALQELVQGIPLGRSSRSRSPSA